MRYGWAVSHDQVRRHRECRARVHFLRTVDARDHGTAGILKFAQTSRDHSQHQLGLRTGFDNAAALAAAADSGTAR
jgi:hypothetical protein